jgi:hypothetical protein
MGFLQLLLGMTFLLKFISPPYAAILIVFFLLRVIVGDGTS